MTVSISKDVRALITTHFARFGTHCETARLIYGATLPRDLHDECVRARARHLKQAEEQP